MMLHDAAMTTSMAPATLGHHLPRDAAFIETWRPRFHELLMHHKRPMASISRDTLLHEHLESGAYPSLRKMPERIVPGPAAEAFGPSLYTLLSDGMWQALTVDPALPHLTHTPLLYSHVLITPEQRSKKMLACSSLEQNSAESARMHECFSLHFHCLVRRY